MVYDAAKAVNIPVIRDGGSQPRPTSWEFMLAGATAVQIARQLMGPGRDRRRLPPNWKPGADAPHRAGASLIGGIDWSKVLGSVAVPPFGPAEAGATKPISASRQDCTHRQVANQLIAGIDHNTAWLTGLPKSLAVNCTV